MCDITQYIAEVMCHRKAHKDQIPCLDFKFWNKSQKANYQSQIVAVKRLVKEFGEEAVMDYIKDNQRVYSLGKFNTPKFIKDGIKRYVGKRKKPIIKEERKVEQFLKPRKFTKNNPFLKIRKAEDG